MRAFLIDFENVKSAGLVGIDTLGMDDQVVILYSVNSNTISFEMHQKIMNCAANVEYYQIRRGGKNSLDFQLSTMLGYLLASGLYTHLYIVSNDSGFDALYDFWTSQYIPTDCVVYRRPNIALSVAHSLFTGKNPDNKGGQEPTDINVTTDDSGAYDTFEMAVPDSTESTIEVKAEEIFPIESEEAQNISGQPENKEKTEEIVENESVHEPDDFETAALLGALQAAQQDEEAAELSAAGRMRQEELNAEEEEMYSPSEPDFAVPEVSVKASDDGEERPRHRRGRPRRGVSASGTVNHNTETEKEISFEKSRQKADPSEIASLSLKLEGELKELCNREQLSAVAEMILLSEGKQEFYRSIIRRFGQKKGLLVYKTIKSDFSALKKK